MASLDKYYSNLKQNTEETTNEVYQKQGD